MSGIARVMQQTDPRKVKVVYENKRWPDIFDNNPRILQRREEADHQILYGRVNGLRPYCSAKSPTRWTWKDCPPAVGEVYLLHHEINFGKLFAASLRGTVLIEPNIKKGASPNKDWGWHRWEALVRLMSAAKITPVQVGPRGTATISGVRLIETENFRLACGVMRQVAACVLPDGGLHHAAAALGKKTVVIFGGFISPRQTGYDSQVNLFTGGEPCGWRTPCEHCAAAMAAITPELVFEELRKLLV